MTLRACAFALAAGAAALGWSQPVGLSWARTETVPGLASVRFTHVLPHPTGRFVVVGEGQATMGVSSSRRIFVGLLRDDRTWAWTRIFDGMGPDFGVYSPRVRVMANGTIVVVARGESTGILKRIDPANGNVFDDYLALSQNGPVVGADVGQDGIGWFAYADDLFFSSTRTDWTNDQGNTFYKTRQDGVHRLYIERAMPGNVGAFGSIDAPIFDTTVRDYPGDTLYRGSEYFRLSRGEAKFCFRFNGEPFVAYAPSGVLKTFLGYNFTSNTELFEAYGGNNIYLSRLVRTGNQPVMFKTVYSAMNSAVDQWFFNLLGLQPDYDIAATVTRTTGGNMTESLAQIRYLGAGAGPDTIQFPGFSFDDEEFYNGFYYRRHRGDSYRGSAQQMGKWRLGQANPEWYLSAGNAFFVLPFMSFGLYSEVVGGVTNYQFSQRSDATGAPLGTLNLAVRPTRFNNMAVRQSDGAVLMVGENNIAGGRTGGYLTWLLQAPMANNDVRTMVKNTVLNSPSVLGNDRFIGTITPIMNATPSKGTITFNANGTFTYTPRTGFVGTDTFTYRLSRPGLNPSTGIVSITVTN